jgi:hypothetical protein
MDGMAGNVARMDETRNAYKILLAKPEGKRPLGRHRCSCDDNIKMDIRETGTDDVDWNGFMWFNAEASGGLLRTL